MPGRQVSTEGVAAREAFSFWRDVICETFIHLDCTTPRSGGFRGSVSSQPFAGLQLSSMASDEIDLTRSTAKIASAREEYCLIVVQGRGRTLAEQDGRQFILEPDDLALFDSVRPYVARLETGFHHFVLKVPREALRRRLGALETLTATRICGTRGIGRLASAFIRGLPGELDALDKNVAPRVADTCLDLVAAALVGAASLTRAGASSTKMVRLVRAKDFIAANIHRCDLSPRDVAVALGISPRYLNDLFADEGVSAGRYIWMLRLDRCRTALADAAQAHRTISEIAFAWGFNDMSHFSRFFREQTGMSARQYRAEAARAALRRAARPSALPFPATAAGFRR